MNDLLKRVGVAILGIPLILFLIYKGGVFFLVFILFVNALALWEFYTIHHGKGIFPFRKSALAASSLALCGFFAFPNLAEVWLILPLFLIFPAQLRTPRGSGSLNLVYTIAGMVYIPLFLALLLHLRLNFDVFLPQVDAPTAGGLFVITMIISLWLCDTGAYFGGKTLGRHKLAPNVSPNKTIEGTVTGFLAAVAGFWLLGSWLLPGVPQSFTLWAGVLVGSVGQIGDLIESRFKRDAGVKDTSDLLPGHGGILDRFDSLIFISPVIWGLCYLAQWQIF